MSQPQNGAPGINSHVFLVGDLRIDVGQQGFTRADIEIILPILTNDPGSAAATLRGSHFSLAAVPDQELE